MSGKTLAGVCAITLLVLAAVVAGNASAALPELGRCMPVEGVTEGKKIVYHGAYNSRTCIKTSTRHNGKYEWVAGPGPKPKWSAFSEAVTLETVDGTQVKCEESVTYGEYTGPKTETAKIDLFNCEAFHKYCQSPTAEDEGEISVESLEGEIGFISDGAKPVVGLDLKHSPEWVAFDCGKSPEVAAAGVLEGSVIGALQKVDTMSSEFLVKYKASAGKQVPESFEGAAKDTLTTTLVVGLSRTVEESGLTTKLEVINRNVENSGEEGEPIEIKAE